MTPAESADGTVIEPPLNSPTESSYVGGAGEDHSLFDASPPPPRKRASRTRKPKLDDPHLLTRFDEWYLAYPVHKARGDAETAYAKAVRDGADPELLIDAARRYHQDPNYLRGYGKNPATWLNAKCWLDEDTPLPPSRAYDRKPGGYRPYHNPADQSDYDLGFA